MPTERFSLIFSSCALLLARWSRRVLRRSPFSYPRSLLRALRWHPATGFDQSPSRGRCLNKTIQPVTCLLRKLFPALGAYRLRTKHSYHLLLTGTSVRATTYTRPPLNAIVPSGGP